MRKLLLVTIVALLTHCSYAQLGGLLNKAKNKVNQRADKKVDNEMDKALDKAEGKKTAEPAAKEETKEETAATAAAPVPALNEQRHAIDEHRISPWSLVITSKTQPLYARSARTHDRVINDKGLMTKD